MGHIIAVEKEQRIISTDILGIGVSKINRMVAKSKRCFFYPKKKSFSLTFQGIYTHNHPINTSFWRCFTHTHTHTFSTCPKAPGLHVSKLQAVFGKQDVLGFDLHAALEINTSAPFLRRVLVTWVKLEVVI